MIKKLLLSLALVISLVSTVDAQQVVGSWTIYPTFDNDVENMVATPSKVYYLSAGTLYSFSPEDSETYIYSTINKLSDVNISNIFYNADKKYLLIAYKSGNIDILYDNGKVVNMSDIKDAVLTDSHAIRDVEFGFDRIFVATDFGLVVFDDDKHEVIESGIYGRPIEQVFLMGENLLIYYGYTLYYSDYKSRHNSLDKFEKLGGITSVSIMPVNETQLLSRFINDTVYKVTIDFNAKNVKLVASDIITNSDFVKNNDAVYCYSADKFYFFSDSLEADDVVDIPEELRDSSLALWSGKDIIWSYTSEGISRYDISGGQVKVLNEPFHPNALNKFVPVHMTLSADGNRLYVYDRGPSQFNTSCSGDGYETIQTINMIENGDISDCSLLEASVSDTYTQNIQKKLNTTRVVGGGTITVEDPDDPSIIYTGNGFEGVYVIKDQKELAHITRENSNISSWWGARVYGMDIDPQGNLWIGFYQEGGTTAPYTILPAEKRRNKITSLTAEDFVYAKFPEGYCSNKDMISVFCKKSNLAFFASSYWASGIVAIDTKGTYADPSDDIAVQHITFTDTEGNKLEPARIISMVEDENGWIWCGTMQGLFVITNPTDAINGNLVVKRPLVPRNDGTNYGDYLLDTEKIYDFAVDPTNRKWIATENSGVYLVSADGTQILQNFTVSNSQLPSNVVYSVKCDPHSNRVFFGTQLGLVSYNSDSTPAASDYSEVYAYPNPVRPDYTGWITITGLMDNSLVKIADISGNVLFQGRSEGGILIWDGCNAGGERVKTGVYLVLASQNETGSSTGVVTKIMVVK